MKKILILPFLVLFAVSACSKKEIPPVISDAKNDSNNISNLPAWVLSPDVEGGIAAVGIASPSKGGIKFQIPQAETDAKANIASTIQSEISRVTKNALREAKVNDVNDVEEVFSQATKDVIKNMPLSGVRRINIYQGSDGTLYVHMMLKEEDFSKYLRNNQNIYEERLRQANLGRENLQKSQEAVKGLFDELEEERKK